MDRPSTHSFRVRNLPHWLVEDRPYFVTMRLQGTLPDRVVREHQQELDSLRISGADSQALLQAKRKQFLRIESILDACQQGDQFLSDPRVAKLVQSSLEWLEQDRGWTIFASTIMPNHAHLLLQHLDGRNEALSEDLGQVKSFTSRRANLLVDRCGAFWQAENFDHWIRNEEKFLSCVWYIQNNPVKAGLVSSWGDWPWTRVKDSVLALL